MKYPNEAALNRERVTSSQNFVGCRATSANQLIFSTGRATALCVAVLLLARVLSFTNHRLSLLTVAISIAAISVASVTWFKAISEIRQARGRSEISSQLIDGALVDLGVEVQALRLEAERQLTDALMESTTNPVRITDRHGFILRANQAFADFVGLDLETLVGKSLKDIDLDANRFDIEPLHDADVIESRLEKMIPEREIVDASGRTRWMQCLKRPIVCSETGQTQVLTVCVDMSERRRYEEQVDQQTLFDHLTGLPNRALFLNRIERAMAQSRRTGAYPSILSIDLDNFTVLKAGLGDEAGNKLLCITATRLEAMVRGGDTVARIGPDQFGILLETVDAPYVPTSIAELVAASLTEPVTIEGRSVNTSASIGIALTDSRWQAAEDVLRCADTAMYHAKRGGKSRAAMFEPGMSDDVLDRIEMEADLRRAILQGDLRVHYQPIVGIESRRIVEVEALCRWTHPKYGEISPDKFIPLAEESGLILTLGKWVLEQACLEHRRWVREFGEADAPICCVNVSLRQIQDDRFVSQVLATLGDTGMDPRSLKLEITEGVFAKDAELTGSRLADLRETGIKFAIDDFGSGYSSLGFLAKLPVNTIKIDRLFTSRIGQGAADDAIIRAIVSLASALKVDVTAEGIETDAQLGVLKALACDRGQGFMISKAVTADAFLKLLREQNLHRD